LYALAVTGIGASALGMALAMFAWQEAIFWCVVTMFGTAMFLFVRPEMPLREKFHRISLVDLMIPTIIIGFATAHTAGPLEAAIRVNSLRLTFLVVFFVGMSTGVGLLLAGFRKRD
jgi:hypothetical protein